MKMQEIGQIFAPSYKHVGPLTPDGVSIFPDEVPIYQVSDKDSRGTDESFTWALPPLYKQNKNGKYSIWQIMYYQPIKKIYTVSGQLGGTLRIYPKDVKVKTGHNLGRQAQIDADSKYNMKFDEGRRPFGSTEPVHTFNVNLAKQYELGRDQIKRWPVSVQPKLDGIRGYAYRVNGDVKIMSRKHKAHPNLKVLREQLQQLFDLLPEGTYIDGELFSPDMSFNQISSAVRSQTYKPANDQLFYYIFDIVYPAELGIEAWEDRVAHTNHYYQAYLAQHPVTLIQLVPEFMVFDHHDLVLYRDSFIEQGYEGLMIRQYAGTVTDMTGSPYQLDPSTRTEESMKISRYHQSSSTGDRPLNILKFKTIEEEEGIVVDIDSGEGTKKGVGMVIVKDKRGNIVRMAVRATDELRSEWLRNKEQYIGLPFTFEYQELTEDGVPRFPIGKAFRNYE